MLKGNRLGVFEIANRSVINNTTKHTHVISDVSGLKTALDGKQDIISGYTGDISVVVGVNFTEKTVTSKTINVSNGIITSIA